MNTMNNNTSRLTAEPISVLSSEEKDKDTACIECLSWDEKADRLIKFLGRTAKDAIRDNYIEYILKMYGPRVVATAFATFSTPIVAAAMLYYESSDDAGVKNEEYLVEDYNRYNKWKASNPGLAEKIEDIQKEINGHLPKFPALKLEEPRVSEAKLEPDDTQIKNFLDKLDIKETGSFPEYKPQEVSREIVKHKLQKITGIQDDKQTEEIINIILDCKASELAEIADLKTIGEKLTKVDEKLEQITKLADFKKLKLADLKDGKVTTDDKAGKVIENLYKFLGYVGTLDNQKLKTVAIYSQSALKIYTSISAINTAFKTRFLTTVLDEKARANALESVSGSVGTILESVAKFFPPKSAVGSMASGAAACATIAPPYGIIAGAAFGLLNHFLSSGKDGPDATAIIMEGVGQLSKQIDRLHQAMCENFEKVYESQLKTIEIVNKGFSDLSKQLDYRFNSLQLQADALNNIVTTRLNEIQNLINGWYSVLEEGQEIIATQSLRVSMQAADTLLSEDIRITSPLQQLIKINSDLAFWVLNESFAPNVNGQVFSLKNNESLLKTKLIDRSSSNNTKEDKENKEEDNFVNSFLGYLVIKAQETSTSYKEKCQDLRIPNPLLWMSAIDKYIALREKFQLLFTEADVQQLNKISDDADKVYNAIIELGKNEDLWKKLFERYEEIVESICKAAEDFGKEVSFTENKPLNDKYNKNKSKNDSIDINLVNNPQAFIDQFKGRMISSLGADEIKLQNSEEKQMHKLSAVPLCIKLSEMVSPAMLAQEYLGLITFNVLQLKTLEKIAIESFDWAMQENFKKINVPSKYAKDLQIKNPTETAGDDEAHDQSTDLILINEMMKTSYWQIPIELIIMLAESKEEECKFSLKREWGELKPNIYHCDLNSEAGDNKSWMKWLHAERRERKEGGQHNLYSCPTTPLISSMDDKSIKQYTDDVSTILSRSWMDDKLEILGDTSQLVSNLGNINTGDIVKYFIKKRINIAQKLFGSLNVSTPSELEAKQRFDNLLVSLDVHVRLIQHLAYVAKSKINEEKVILGLLTSAKIRSDLDNYSKNPSNTIDTKLIPSLYNHSKLTYAQIVNENNSIQLSATHPQVLLSKICLRFSSYKNRRTFLFNSYPDLMYYLDFGYYQQSFSLGKFEAFEEEVLERLNEIIRFNTFNMAYNNLVAGRICYMLGPYKNLADKYSEYFNNFDVWTNCYSTQFFQSNFASKKNDVDLQTIFVFGGNGQDEKIDSSIKLLGQFTENLKLNPILLYSIFMFNGGGNFDKKTTPYPAIWFEGVEAILKIILKFFDERSKEGKEMKKIALIAAKKEENEDQQTTLSNLIDNNIEILNRCFELGQNLRNVFYTIGKSRAFFDKLFNIYINLLNTIKTLQTIYSMNDQTLKDNLGPSNIDNQGTKGQCSLLRDRIKACCLLLQKYIELIFAYDIIADQELNTLYKSTLEFEQFFPSLVSSNQKTSTQVDNLVKNVNALKERVDYTIDIAQSLSNFQQYLENYLECHQRYKTLCIREDKGSYFKYGISCEAFILIDQFLKATDTVSDEKESVSFDKIEFDGILIDGNRIDYLAIMLNNHIQRIKELNLINVGLDITTFLRLERVLSNLTTLNLSNNKLDGSKENNIEAFTNLLSKATNLTHLNLSNNENLFYLDSSIDSKKNKSWGMRVVAKISTEDAAKDTTKETKPCSKWHNLFLAKTGLRMDLGDTLTFQALDFSELEVIDISYNPGFWESAASFSNAMHKATKIQKIVAIDNKAELKEDEISNKEKKLGDILKHFSTVSIIRTFDQKEDKKGEGPSNSTACSSRSSKAFKLANILKLGQPKLDVTLMKISQTQSMLKTKKSNLKLCNVSSYLR